MRALRTRLLLAVGTTLLMLLLGEVGLRVLGIDAPGRETGVVPHPLWHHWHRADFSFSYRVVAEGISRQVVFNSFGMRNGRVPAPRKRGSVMRVAVLGDSFAEALQVEEEEGVCRRLEELLGASTPCEVLNFGCSGFSSSLEYIQLRDWVRSLEPDLVICLHHFSDITEDWRFASRAEWDRDELRAIRPSGGGWGRRCRALLEWSHVYRVSSTAWERTRRHRPPDPDASLQESFDAIVDEPYTPADDAAWDYSLGYIRRMNQLLERDGTPFLVVVIPIGTQVEPVDAAFAQRVSYRYLAGGGRLEHTGYQRHVTAFCAEEGIDCLDLLELFRAANPDGRPLLYLPRDQHWTAAGHELAAREIERHISARKNPEAR